MHGIGVSTPKAAAVAAATAGFAGDIHIPNGATLTVGLLSKMFAACSPVMTRAEGAAVKGDGVVPKLHCSTAPVHTITDILIV